MCILFRRLSSGRSWFYRSVALLLGILIVLPINLIGFVPTRRALARGNVPANNDSTNDCNVSSTEPCPCPPCNPLNAPSSNSNPNGIMSSDMVMEGKGYTNPVVSNKSKEIKAKRAKNLRRRIKAYGKGRTPNLGGRTPNGSSKPKITKHPVFFLNGSAIENATDLSLPGPTFDLTFSRSYDSSLYLFSNTGEVLSPLGDRWIASSRGPYLNQFGQDTEMQISASTKRVFEGSSLLAPDGYNATMEIKNKDTASEEYWVTEHDTGVIYKFHGWGKSGTPALEVEEKLRGRLREKTSRAHEARFPGGGIEYDYGDNGFTSFITPAEPQKSDYLFAFSYTDSDRVSQISLIKNSVTIRKVEYTYFDSSHHGHLGSLGDLVQVKVSQKDSGDTGGDFSIVRHTQYRYFDDSHEDVDGDSIDDGGVHQLKMVLEADAIERILADNANLTNPDQLLLKADGYSTSGSAAIKDFASRSFSYYTYDLKTDNNGLGASADPADPKCLTAWEPSGGENLQDYGGSNFDESKHPFGTYEHGVVKSEVINGSCGSCGASSSGGIRKDYYYLKFSNWNANNTERTVFAVVEDTVSLGTVDVPQYRRIFALNYNGLETRSALLVDPITDPGVSLAAAHTEGIWCTSNVYDSNWKISERRMPSAHRKNGTKGVESKADLAKFLNPTSSSNDIDTVNSDKGIVYYYSYDDGYPKDVWIREGAGANGFFMNATDYWSNQSAAGSDSNILPSKSYSYNTETPYDSSGTQRGNGIETEYFYSFWDTEQTILQSVETRRPSIGTDQNGSSVRTSVYEYLDRLGRVRWTVDGEGYINYFSYHPDTGALAYEAIDVDPAQMPNDASGNDAKWVSVNDDGSSTGYHANGKPGSRDSALPAALNLVTNHEFDEHGRLIKTTDASNKDHCIVYDGNRTISFPYWDSTSGKPGLPINVVETNDGGKVIEAFSVDPAQATHAAGKPTGFVDSQDSYLSWTRNFYHKINGQLVKSLRYHSIPDTGSGNHIEHYYVQAYQYDSLGNVATIVRSVQDQAGHEDHVVHGTFDDQNRVVKVEIDSVDSGLNTDPNGELGMLDLAGLTSRIEVTYDFDSVGDGHVSSSKVYHTVDSGESPDEYTFTKYHRTFRGHLRGAERFFNNETTSIGPHSLSDIDWLGRTVASAQYSVAPSSWPDDYTNYVHDPAANSGIGGPTGSNFINTTITKYDVLGRVYRTLRFPGVQAAKHFEINNYYNRNSQLVCSGDKHSAHTEYAYDGAGRSFQWRTVKDVSSSPYSSGAFVYNEPQPDPEFAIGSDWDIALAGDGNEGVIEIAHVVYEASGNATERYIFELNHDDTDGIDIDDDDSYVRRSVYSWYGDADRLRTMADYGASDGGAFTGDTWKYTDMQSSLPTEPTVSTSSVLVTQYGYDSVTGRQDLVTDPAGVETKTFFDDLGRRVAVAENFDNFALPDSNIGPSDKDRVTTWEYNGLGQTKKLTAHNGNTPQTTEYEYTDPHNVSLVTKSIYPDGDSTDDNVQRTYNLDGSLASMKDQRGVEHVYYYNNRRQLELDAVETLNGVDGYVESIKRTYESTFGRLTHITSYDDDDGTGTVRNEIKYNIDAFGIVDSSRQDHEGAVGGSEPNVTYSADAGATSNVLHNGLRVWQVQYPNGARVDFERGHDDGDGNQENIHDRLNRVSGIDWDEDSTGAMTDLTEYAHNGTGRLAKTDFLVPDVSHLAFATGGNNYNGWDKFGRTLLQEWVDNTGTPTTRDEISYSYDYAGNRLTRDVVTTTNNIHDQVYTYDGLHRLKKADIGTSSVKSHSYSYDQLGNWSNHDISSAVTTAGDMHQTRTHNSVNEIDTLNTDIYSGSSWVDANWVEPAYDDAGNMTTMPQSGDPTSDYALEYDAWNRLIEVKDGGTTVQANRYDGLNRRIVKTVGANSYDYYYNRQWQVLEVRKNGSVNPWKQYVYHPHYVDAVAMRRFDENTDGDITDTNEGEHYYLQDANFNVTAVVDETGAVEERYTYTPYGEVTVLDDVYAAVSGNVSAISNESLYTGRRRDPETGLQLNRFRFYASHLGRWINRDPSEYEGSPWNLYEYVDSDPLSLIDPFGLIPQDKGWGMPSFGDYCYYFCGTFDDDFDDDLGTIGNVTYDVLDTASDLAPAGKGKKVCKKIWGHYSEPGKGHFERSKHHDRSKGRRKGGHSKHEKKQKKKKEQKEREERKKEREGGKNEDS